MGRKEALPLLLHLQQRVQQGQGLPLVPLRRESSIGMDSMSMNYSTSVVNLTLLVSASMNYNMTGMNLNENIGMVSISTVSYTHLTLPTN